MPPDFLGCDDYTSRRLSLEILGIQKLACTASFSFPLAPSLPSPFTSLSPSLPYPFLPTQPLTPPLPSCHTSFSWFHHKIQIGEINRPFLFSYIYSYSVYLPQRILLDFPSVSLLASLPFFIVYHRTTRTVPVTRHTWVSNWRLMVHIHWASHARNQWSHVRPHIFPGNKLYGMHQYIVFF